MILNVCNYVCRLKYNCANISFSFFIKMKCKTRTKLKHKNKFYLYRYVKKCISKMIRAHKTIAIDSNPINMKI